MVFSSITAVGSFTDLDPSDGDYLHLDPRRCTDTTDLRTTVENSPGASGADVFPPLDGARFVTLSGPIVITSSSTSAGIQTALAAVIADINSALSAMKTAAAAVVSAEGSVNYWAHSNLSTSFDNGQTIATFTLVAD